MSGSTYDNFSNAQAARLDALKETSKMVAGMKGNGALAPLAQNGLDSLQVASVIELAQFVIGESESEDVNIVINASYEAEEELSEDMPVEPAPTDADRVRVGLTEPSVNVTETPDLSTEDAGKSSEPAPADVDPDEVLGSVVDVTDLYAQLDKAEADLTRVTKERYKWEGRFVALREGMWIESGSRVAAVAAAAHGILARDDERAES